MKQQLGLIQLAQEIQRQSEVKQDYLVNTRNMEVRFEDNEAHLALDEVAEEFVLADTAHKQMAGRLGIPTRYYDRLRSDHPDLLETQVNALLHREPEQRMVRTLDGEARAILSDRFRRLDHDQLIETVLPVIAEQELDLEQSSFALTSERLYMKLVLPRIEQEVREGDLVQSGIVVSNSEIGLGALSVVPMVFRLVCTNGMVAPESISRVKKQHRGARHDILGELLRQETLDAHDRAFWMEVADLTDATLDPQHFELLVERMRLSTERQLEGDPVKAIEVMRKTFQLTESESEGILAHLVRGGELTQYGLLNAVTRHAQDLESYSRSTDLEEIGGKILEMPDSAWRRIARAA